MTEPVKFPIAVALAEKFLWQVFLTTMWDHLFEENPTFQTTALPILPNKLSFCPTSRVWREIPCHGRPVKEIDFREPSIRAHVQVRMKRSSLSEPYRPSTITFDIPVLDGHRAHNAGVERLKTDTVIVWHPTWNLDERLDEF